MHVIKHMQRFNNGDSMMVSDLCNSVKLRREIASDLVLHEGNREKQTIIAIVCTKTSTRAMKKLLLWYLLFFYYLYFPSPHIVMFIRKFLPIGWPYIVTLFIIKSILFWFAILFFQYGRQIEIVIYKHHSCLTCLIFYNLLDN